MKRSSKISKLLALLLAVTTVLTAAGCAGAADKKEEWEPPVINTTPNSTGATEETLAPIYTRPEEEEMFVEPEGEHMEEELHEKDIETGTSTGTNTDSGNSSGASAQAQPGSALTWANIKSFPVKSASMSVAQLRQLCVDFFRFTKTATWIPSTTIRFVRNSKGSSDSMTGGTRYGGFPYIGNGTGNVYRMMDYINESSGVLDMSDFLGDTSKELTMKQLFYFGNQCANGAHQAWGRVINSVKKTYTAAMTKSNGYIPLGNYTYTQKEFTSNSRTTAVCQQNGEQVMYEAYALLQPADGVVYYTSAGHVMMASSAPTVVRNPDGTIDGEKSYIYTIDQAQGWKETENADGVTYQYKSGVDERNTFKALFDSNYLPFTFAEFTGADPVENTTCSFSHTAGTVTADQLFKAKVTGNYAVTDAYAIVTDGSGREVYRHAVRNTTGNAKTLTMAKSGANVDSWGTLSSGTYSVKVEAQLSTGERLTIYTGTLTV